MGHQITYPGASGQVDAYVAKPSERSPLPAVILVRALLSSVDASNRMADRIAGEGYLCMAPNHYANDPVVRSVSTADILAGIRIAHAADIEAALDAAPPEKREVLHRVIAWWDTRDTTYIADLFAAIDYVKARDDVQANRVAVIGFGGAGLLTGKVLVAGADLAAAVIYSGRPPAADNVQSVSCPVLGHYGSEDRESTAHVPALQAAMKAHGKPFAPYFYDRAHHLFFDEHHEDYDKGAADLAWERTVTFLRQQLTS